MFSLTKKTTQPTFRHQGTHQGLYAIVACHAFHLGPNGGRVPGIHGRLMMDVRFVEASVMRWNGWSDPMFFVVFTQNQKGRGRTFKKGAQHKMKRKIYRFCEKCLANKMQDCCFGEKKQIEIEIEIACFLNKICVLNIADSQKRDTTLICVLSTIIYTHTQTQTMPYRCLDIRIIQTAAPYLICK